MKMEEVTTTEEKWTSAKKKTRTKKGKMAFILTLYFFFILFTNIFSVGLSQYVVDVGGKIGLECNTSFWAEDELISLILWYKGNTGAPLYSVDARSKSLLEAKHTTTESRMYLNVSLSPPTLTINPVELTDAGDYRCRVDYVTDRTQNTVSTLKVIVPPKDVIVMDSEGQRLEGVVGPFDEDSQLTLVCQSFGGLPSPSLSWWMNEKLADESWTPGPPEIIRNEIKLTLTRDLLLVNLSCRASVDHFLHRKQVQLTIDLNLRPLEAKIIPPKGRLSANRRVEFECLSYGSKPVVTISWFLNKEKISGNVKTRSTEDGNVTRSLLSFVPTPKDNGKHIICKAENMNLDQNQIKDELLLNIFYVPQLSVDLGANLNAQAIREGIDVFLECDVDANPPIREMIWTFNEKPLSSNLSDGILVANHSLVLQKVKRHHRGQYRCLARNDAGEGSTDSYFLRVQFAPICKANQRINYGVTKSEMAIVGCEVEADPSQLTFKWFMNTSSTVIDITDFSVNGTKSFARYIPKSRFGYGSIFCLAENSIGRQRHPCVFNIIPAGPPEKLINCTLVNQSLTSLLVECIPGDSNGLEQYFFAQISDTESGILFNLTNEVRPSFWFENLASGTSYIVKMYSKNSKGKSNPIQKVFSTYSLTQNEMKQGPGEEEQYTGAIFNPLITILTGLVGVLILLGVVLAIIMRIRVDSVDSIDGFAEYRREKKSDSKSLDEKACVYQMYQNTTNCDPSCLEQTPGPFEMKEHIFLVSEDSGTFGRCSSPSLDRYPPLSTVTAIKKLESAVDNEYPMGITRSPLDQRQQRLSLITEKCNEQLLPNRESLRVDGCSETETPIETPLMKNIRISCDGSEVTISFKLPEPTTPETIISRTTPV